MRTQVFHSAVTRISDLARTPYSIGEVPRVDWRRGDYVLARVRPSVRTGGAIELRDGRMAEILEGDLVLGALGRRFATLEAVGDFQAVEADLRMDLLTGGGLMGRVTSWSRLTPEVVPLQYEGHVRVDGEFRRMTDYVDAPPEVEFRHPVILIVGTSMSAGKTTAARVVIRQLKELELTVVGAKLTGAGRYRDILAMKDAGADAIFDFMDVGLPSTVLDPTEFRFRLAGLLARIAATRCDVVVAEAGASPLEPYNGGVAMELLSPHVRCTILCASDPYAAKGITSAFGSVPDFVAGPTTNTEAGIELVRRLTGLRSINVMDPACAPAVRGILESALLPEPA